MNSVLKTILQDGKYLTAQGCYVNRGLATLTLVNAGHPGPIHVKASGEASVLGAEGDILGAFQTVCIEPVSYKIEPGDRLYLYTDGLTERFGDSSQSRQQGEAELLRQCQRLHSAPLAEVAQRVVDVLFPGAKPPEDDVVLLAVEI